MAVGLTSSESTYKEYLYSCDEKFIMDADSLAHSLFAGFVVFFSLISMITCVVICYSIYKNKMLRDSHPSLLIAIMSLCEFITCYHAMVWQLSTVNFACYLELPSLYAFLSRIYEWITFSTLGDE
jgi:hypothetical protein